MGKKSGLPGFKKEAFFLLSLMFPFILAYAVKPLQQEPGIKYPCPKVKNMLFYLQRDPDQNTVIYELNYKSDGTLYDGDPVKGSWIRYTENGQRKELNAIENKFAYGIQSKALGNGEYRLLLVSYKKMPLYLKRFENTYKVHAMFNKIPVIITRIFVHVKGGSFLFPNIQYIELTGNDLVTGKEIFHRIKI
jgi:hypothetical protein